MIPLPKSSAVRPSLSLQSLIAYAFLGILILVSAFAYISNIHLVVRQSDPATYYYAGLRIAEVGSPSFCDGHNDIAGSYFTLLGFKVRQQDDGSCFYPNLNIGFPLLIASTRFLGPVPEMAPYVTPFIGLIGLIAVFVLGQVLFDRPTGLLAAAFLAFNPVYWTMTTEMWSDVPAMTFLVLGIFFAVRMIKQDSVWLGFVGGALLGYACLIRYHSILALLPLGLYFWATTRGQAKPKRALVGFGCGLGLLVLAILAYHKLTYGGFLRTGYGTQQGEVPWPRFSLSYFYDESPIGEGGYRAIYSALAENFNIGGLLMAIGAVVVMHRAKALLVGGLAGVFCVFYSFYAWPTTGLNVRFLLPTFSMICLSLAFGIVYFIRLLLSQKEIVVLSMLPLIIVAWHAPSVRTTLLNLERRNRYVETQVALVKEFTQATEPDAVFLSREYHDLIILYGQRSALLYPMLVTADNVSQRYQLSDYETRLVETVDKLLENDVPVYVVVEPEGRSFLQGPIDPYPILSRHFGLVPFRTEIEPVIYRVGWP